MHHAMMQPLMRCDFKKSHPSNSGIQSPDQTNSFENLSPSETASRSLIKDIWQKKNFGICFTKIQAAKTQLSTNSQVTNWVELDGFRPKKF